MKDSTENAALPKSTKSRNSYSSVPIQIKAKSQFEFVPRDANKSESLDWEDLGNASFAVETVIWGGYDS